ncbi:AAEL005016-PA [Aedes aegypti]|uniref:Malectin domain-containing protein n=2 Tax=Aedes aegypti TaxID=7159 RepID=Q17BA6_AEDAE|nr:malectin-A [Aedes aegypti]XP_021703612.1 malectin-A [Aedes aegypti]XP_021703613.1 malectin-A [Aedes aegypti]XP_021703614.1 malectin-A [Aedes aegypti]EAT43540.1 AAEL005016-PA [Aedes aegypti]
MPLPYHLVSLLLGIVLLIQSFTNAVQHNVIYAINAGGEAHVDSNGIKYARDPLMGKTGTESDYGKQLLMINRVKPNDELLYQTERYHHDSFGYELPIAGDGEYVLILKFCEVYFNAPNMKVFDVLLNSRHMVITDLDIFSLVGKGTAHDEYVYFTVSRGRLYFKEEDSEIRGGKVKLEFLKGYKDNPKINAIVLIKGYDEATLPRLASLVSEQQASQELHADTILNEATTTGDGDVQTEAKAKQRKTSGPKQPNPYSLDESSMMLPVFIAIGAFIPLLFCLCRL